MEPGEVIAERYRLVSLIGRGAMGAVWLAHDDRLDRRVAVKQLLVDGEDAVARALREGRNAGRLRHPHAVAVFDVAEHDGRPCLVMEYLPSTSLAATAGLRPREVAAIGAQLASALAAAHAAGIVHRDIKPDNVLIAVDGTAKITDFGISRAEGEAAVTATGVLAGTPAYLAPEVARGREADKRSDVFSLGATLYAVLEGTPPFGVEDNAIAMLHKVAGGTITPPRRSGELAGALRWLLHEDPAARPSMAAAQEALAAAAEGREMAPPSPTLLLPTRRGPSRRTILVGAGGAVLVAAGVLAGSLLTSPDSTGSAAPPATSSSAAEPPACTARFTVGGSWPDGYQSAVTVRNEGTRTITGWQLSWTMPDGHRVANLWGGQFTQTGSAVAVTNADYNVTIPAGGSVEVGMTVAASTETRDAPEVRCTED
ncbi:serine/threonine-protein kinase [Amycolatopsis sp. 195334CR]|uniref:serine/threonine-protein kinase n=1 Tax=Amycolatopsis sp. 195334CR TaxID=2814588 RepID=UPI001A90520C|nr:serine/threonine-protein kinase [Amycolatopsis sp. 195334CR]MBN6038927.1 protein kinase [Amycolatopsis sp. 195334CR]